MRNEARSSLTMDSNIDFSSYSLDELYSASKSIDRLAHPARAKEIDRLIAQQEALCNQDIDQTRNAGELATRSDRLLAAIIDGVLGMIMIMPIFFYIGIEELKTATLLQSAGIFFYGICTTMILHGYLLYYYAQTIGKHYLSIRVENLDGSKANFRTICFKRLLPFQLLAQIPLLGPLIVGIINPLFIFTKQRRCLHDRVASTKVSYVCPE